MSILKSRPSKMNDLVFADLKIEVIEGDAGVPTRLFWNGRSTERDPSQILLPFFARILSSATESRTALEMHFERLEYCNSLTIMSLIQLVRDAREQGISLVFVYQGTLRWQKMMFDALRVLTRHDGLLELRGS
jgi:hypothetical protein